MEWGGLLLFILGGLGIAWWFRPQRCEECSRVLGPPTDGELAGESPIGCKRCNLNLRAVPFGWFDENWNPCDPPAPR